MATIGLVIREDLSEALPVANGLLEWAQKEKHQIVFSEKASAQIPKTKGESLDIVVKKSNVIVSLGGDGTLLSIAKVAAENGVPVIGVNFGNLGFLTEISPLELISVLKEFFAEHVKYATRYMFRCRVVRENKDILIQDGINDVVIQKGSNDPLIQLDISSNSEALMRLRADGVIVATPTGSTAYSLAAGGSIAFPTLPVMLVTPICPHSLTNRPLILPIEHELVVKIPANRGSLGITVDGLNAIELAEGDSVHVNQSPWTLKLVRSPSRSYFDILRNKLNWGIANRSV